MYNNNNSPRGKFIRQGTVAIEVKCCWWLPLYHNVVYNVYALFSRSNTFYWLKFQIVRVFNIFVNLGFHVICVFVQFHARTQVRFVFCYQLLRQLSILLEESA